MDLKNAPGRFYPVSAFNHAIEVFNLTTIERIGEYKRFKYQPADTVDTAFAEPDDLYADKEGNMYFPDIYLFKYPQACVIFLFQCICNNDCF